ncbi:MAG: hypothetical protein ACYDBB_00300 [Armatimonadota bacterium]
MTASFTFVTSRHAEPVLPIIIMLDNTGALPSQERQPITDHLSRQLFQAAMEDFTVRCAELSRVRLYWWCAYPWRALRNLPIPRWTRSLESPNTGMPATQQMLLIAGDAPTIPAGYLESAVATLQAGTCAWVLGKADGMSYLFGWSTGAGTVHLPDWHRFLQRDGFAQLRRDLRKGYSAPAVEAILTRNGYIASPQSHPWLRLV